MAHMAAHGTVCPGFHLILSVFWEFSKGVAIIHLV